MSAEDPNKSIDPNKIEIKKIQKTNIEPNSFKPSDSFHEQPNNDNINSSNTHLELMRMKGKKNK